MTGVIALAIVAWIGVALLVSRTVGIVAKRRDRDPR